MSDFVSGDIPQRASSCPPQYLHSLLLSPLAPSKTHHTRSQSAPAREAFTSGWLLCSKLFHRSSQARTHCLGEGDTFVGSARGQATPEPGTWSRLAPPRENLSSTLLRPPRSLDTPASLRLAGTACHLPVLSRCAPGICLPRLLNSMS